MIRVVLVDDHELFRAGVRGELREDIEIAGEACSGADAIALIRDVDPDVVLLDVHLPDGGGEGVIAGHRRAASGEPTRSRPRRSRLRRHAGSTRRRCARRQRI